jgi:hypothetical protein
MNMIAMRVTAGCLVAGRAVEAGRIVELDPGAAFDLVAAGRGEPIDRAAFARAVSAHAQQIGRACERARRFP